MDELSKESWSLTLGVVLELDVSICMKVTMPDGFYFLGCTGWRSCHPPMEVSVIGGRSKRVGKVWNYATWSRHVQYTSA